MAQQALRQDSFIGHALGHYRIVEKIGEGGMGAVYRAQDVHLGCDVAIKVLLPGSVNDENSRRRFRKEARILSRLNHPNIVVVHDVDTEQDLDYLVMEYIPGMTLNEKLASSKLPQDDIIAIGTELAQGLSAAHERGVIHSDLKPGNLRLTEDGRLKILDFGLARLHLPQTPTATTASLRDNDMLGGTLPYMAPEQLQGGDIDARTDIHAAGCVLYQMATGRHPFAEVKRSQLIGAILHKPLLQPTALNPEVSPELERIISKCLEKEPANRYQSARELVIDLRRLQGGCAVTGPMPMRRSIPVSWSWVVVGFTILALVMAMLIVYRRWRDILPRGEPQRIRSLAVLPVKNFSDDPGQDLFADGMTDALIADLAQIKQLNVISRTSVMHYKGTSETIPHIAEELSVDGIVESSVVRSGGRVRLTAQLIDARQDRHLWGTSYERDMADVLVLQSEFVEAIANEIRAKLTPQQTERLSTTRRVDPEVYDYTLKGKAALEYATRENDFRQAIELFQKALDRDPSYAPAWAGLGESTWSLAATGFEFVPPWEVRQKVIAAAEKALQLDPILPDAHKARATIAWDGEWDLESAQQHYRRALDLRPSYAAAHNLYAQMLAGQPLQRFDEARRHLDHARELDPLSPWNDINSVAFWLYQGQAERAYDEAKLASQRNPVLWIIRWEMGLSQLLLGHPVQAVTDLEAALKLAHPDRPSPALATLGLAYGLAGRQSDALKTLTEMKQKPYVSPYHLAAVYSGLGRMDEAFRLLDQAFEQRTPWLVFCTRYDPLSVALRRDPRWKSFSKRLQRAVRLAPGTANLYF